MKIYGRVLPDWFVTTEKYLRLPIIFSMLYVYGGLFASKAVSIVPKKLVELINKYAFFRLLGILSLSYTATGEVEYAIVSTIIFLMIMHLLRDEEERKKMPYGF